jgi:hypothetical protein
VRRKAPQFLFGILYPKQTFYVYKTTFFRIRLTGVNIKV